MLQLKSINQCCFSIIFWIRPHNSSQGIQQLNWNIVLCWLQCVYKNKKNWPSCLFLPLVSHSNCSVPFLNWVCSVGLRIKQVPLTWKQLHTQIMQCGPYRNTVLRHIALGLCLKVLVNCSIKFGKATNIVWCRRLNDDVGKVLGRWC